MGGLMLFTDHDHGWDPVPRFSGFLVTLLLFTSFLPSFLVLLLDSYCRHVGPLLVPRCLGQSLVSHPHPSCHDCPGPVTKDEGCSLVVPPPPLPLP